MAFPTIPTVAGGRILFTLNTAGGATKTFPNLSSLTKSAGDLLLAICVEYDGNSTNAEFSGWGGSFTEFGDFAGTATMAIGCAYKVSTGSETGTFTVTTADTTANDSVLILMSIPGAHASTAPEAGGFATGTGAAADPASFNPGGWDVDSTLWVAVGASGEDSTTGTFTVISTAPTNFTGTAASSITADVVGGVSAAVAFRQQAVASQDVGTWSVDTTQARNAALVIAVRGAGVALTASPTDSVSLTDALVIDWTADRIPSDTVALADVATPVEVGGGTDHTVPLSDTVAIDGGLSALLDSFTRANEDPLTTNWNGPLAPALAQLRVVSNQLLPNASAFGGNWWDAATFGPDCEAYVTLTTEPGNDQEIYLYARLQNAGTTSLDGYYALLVPRSGSNDDEFYIHVMTDGVGSELDFDGSVEWASGDKMMIRCVGSTIEGWRCPVSTGVWVKLLEATNSTYTGAGHIGLGVSPGATVLDDFGGGTVGASRLTFARGKAATDSLAIADSPTRVATALRTVTDSVSLADSATPTVPGGAESVNPSDTLSVSDAVNVNWVASRSSASTVALADARTFAQGEAVADAVALADARTFARGKAVADSVALADSATPSEAGAHTRTPADSLSLADSLTRVVTYTRTVADGVILTDQTIDAQGIRLGDTVAVADVATPTKAKVVSISDSVVLADARAIAQGQAQADSISLADATTRVRAIAKAFTDGITLTDSTKDAQGVRLGDTVTPADVLARVHTATRAVADSVTLADENFRDEGGGADLTASPTDSLSLSDALTITWTADRIPSDAVAISDSLSTGANYAVTPTDTVALTWQVVTEFTRILDSATDQITLADALTFAQGQALADTVSLADLASPAKTGGHVLNPSDSIVLADALTRVMAYGRTQSDGLILVDSTRDAQGIRLGDVAVIVDALARAVTAARTLTDSIVLSDARSITQGQAVADTVALADQLSRVLALARTLTDSVLIADARVFTRGRAVADAVALADQLTRVSSSIRTIADSVALFDSAVPAKAGAGSQPVNDLLVVSDTFSRIATATRAVADSVALADARSIGQGQALTDSLSIADARTLARGQSAADAVALTDQLARTVTYLRSVADSVAILDAAGTTFAGTDSAQVNELIALADSLQRVIFYARALADTVPLADAVLTVGARQLALADTVTIADEFARMTASLRFAADTIIVTDARSIVSVGPFQRVFGHFKNRPRSRVGSNPRVGAFRNTPEDVVD